MRPEPSFARSLVAWGNECLAGRLPIEAFDVYVPSTAYVRALSFRDESAVLGTASAWWAAIRAGSSEPVQLMLDASSGAGSEIVVVAGAGVPLSAWRQSWDRIARATSPPWFDATFTRIGTPERLPPRGRSVGEVSASLSAALEGLVALSQRVDLESWGGYFAHALAVLRGDSSPAQPSPLPPTVPPAAHALAHAANLADVFGGMGSWNDFAPLADREAEHERARLSSDLYRAMCEALVATAHSCEPARA